MDYENRKFAKKKLKISKSNFFYNKAKVNIDLQNHSKPPFLGRTGKKNILQKFSLKFFMHKYAGQKSKF